MARRRDPAGGGDTGLRDLSATVLVALLSALLSALLWVFLALAAAPLLAAGVVLAAIDGARARRRLRASGPLSGAPAADAGSAIRPAAPTPARPEALSPTPDGQRSVSAAGSAGTSARTQRFRPSSFAW